MCHIGIFFIDFLFRYVNLKNFNWIFHHNYLSLLRIVNVCDRERKLESKIYNFNTAGCLSKSQMRALKALVAYNTSIEGMMKHVWEDEYISVIISNSDPSIPIHIAVAITFQYTM